MLHTLNLVYRAGACSAGVIIGCTLVASPAVSDETVDVVYAMVTDIEDMDPHSGRGGGSAHLVTTALFNPLVSDFDGATRERGIRPALAASWENIDELTWRFVLRDDVVFHNGERLTSDDVKFSIERIHDPEFPTGQAFAELPISHVEVIDELTFDIVTTAPVGSMLAHLTRNGAFILPRSHYEGIDLDTAARNPVGTGPFKLAKWTRDEQIVLEVNEDYWGGAANFDRLVFKVIPEASSRLVQLISGEVDITPILGDMVPQVEAAEGVHPVIADSLGRAMIGINTQSQEALGDKRVRQALNWAIDTQGLIAAFGFGAAEQSLTMVNPPNEHPGLEPYGYDPDRAKALIREAGYEPEDISLRMEVGAPAAEEWSEVVASYIRAIGVEVDYSPIAEAVWRDRLAQQALPDLHPHIWSASENMPETDMWAVHPDRQAQSTLWRHDEWVELYAELQSATNQDRRDELNHRLQEILHDESPWINLFRVPLIRGVSDRIEGYWPHPSALVEDYASIRVVE